jgi:hypothetical protein
MMFSLAADYTRSHTSLPAAHLKDCRSSLMVFDGDIHNSVFPAALERGWRVLDDFAGEAAGNKLEKNLPR